MNKQFLEDNAKAFQCAQLAANPNIPAITDKVIKSIEERIAIHRKRRIDKFSITLKGIEDFYRDHLSQAVMDKDFGCERFCCCADTTQPNNTIIEIHMWF